jgi:predicted ATPase
LYLSRVFFFSFFSFFLFTTYSTHLISSLFLFICLYIVDSMYKMDSQELGQLIFKKTNGNPYFVNQFLRMLYKNGHIRFVESTETGKDEIVKIGGWMCDTEAIENANYTSNVVDMMVANLRLLPNSIQNLLGAAAIIGNQFEILPLAIICHKPKQEMISELTTILKYVFIFAFKFTLNNFKRRACNSSKHSGAGHR